MLKILSSTQETRLSEISSTWLENAFMQRSLDKSLIENSLKWLYGLIGLPMPTIYYAESPMRCQTATRELKLERLKKGLEWKNINCQARYEIEHQVNRPVSGKASGRVRKHVWEQTKQLGITKLQFEFHLKNLLDGGFENFSSDGMRAIQWCSYYDFFREIGVLKCKDFERYREFIFGSGVSMSIYEASIAIVCPNPSYAMLNDNFQLHCPDGPSISWEDGYKLYFLNGVRVSEVFFMPDHEIDPILLLKEKNAEARREIIRRLGIEKVIQSLGTEVIDRRGDYELLTLDIPGMKNRPTYLKMLNPSVKVWHIEGVPPHIKTCEEALAWRDSELRYIIPEQLT